MPGLNLSRFEAEGRSRVISSPKYSIYLDLTDKSNYFESITTIEFDAIFGTSTFVDLVSKRIDAITLNGRALDPNIYYQDYRIRLEDLQKQNRLTVRSLQQYSNQGEGLHKFVDPADGLTYLYSQFEVPDSRKVFAVFEQPDIKGTFTFTVVAPKTWEVISTQPTVSPKPATWIKHGEAQIFSFTKTPKLSSYVTSICAGPYKVFYDELTNTDGRTIPLRLMCRQSLAQHFDVETIFDITKKGFQFYGENFNFPYPYAKYDQIFVPEFNAGAMENAGTITYTDNYIFRSATAQPMYERRCVTILHELAHMWFGDLVTMKWWNDLWLNESFAEYMSTLATAEATVYQDIWTTFNIMEKTWAFGQDDLPTTHPIAADIKDLEDVQVNFDGITYAKGASTLKQFVEYVGRENFFEGLSQYLRKHAFANATLSDLISEIESASKRDLKSWCISWLESAGPNTLKPILTTNQSGTVTKFQIEQTAPEAHPTLRPHRLGIGFYDFNPQQKLVQKEYYTVDIDGSLTTLALKNFQPPALILLNDADLTYAKTILDSKSLTTALESVEKISDSLARSLVLNALYDMVLNTNNVQTIETTDTTDTTTDNSLSIGDNSSNTTNLTPQQYLKMVFRALPTETSPAIIRQLILNIQQVLNLF
ncbi:MAG: aminopeptidase N, partial [Bifidobacteriaceae bacterium]|nr:aminopeptidase N [Bifidobacteriaceae bacterium]